MQKTKVIIILGPTSSGKSDLAVDLAKQIDGEIISVDSRQIYKDMNLGTGKVEGKWTEIKGFRSKFRSKASEFQSNNALPSGSTTESHLTELLDSVFMYEDIPHHIIDFQDPRTHSASNAGLIERNIAKRNVAISPALNDHAKKYTVIHFRRDCLRLIKEISNRGKVPILCGGTGFWISALVDNVEFPKVKPDEKLRLKLEKQSVTSLFKKLQKQDPERAEKIDSQNKYRLVRALEICDQLGTVPKAKANPPKNIDFLQIGLDWPVEKLAKKIKKRLASRWTDGMIEEIKNLKEKYQMSWEEIQAFGLAYHWIPLYLQNKLTDSQENFITDKKLAREELLQRVYFAEKNYAKRQRTWFKRDQRIVWGNDLKEILKLTKKFLG
jgi:tRNA dimethylallyltransferase